MLLLDTSALLYYVTAASKKFGTRTTQLLDKSELLYSPLSVVELKQKSQKGTLSLSRIDGEVFEELGLRSISLNKEAVDMKILRLGLEYVLDFTD